MIFFRKPPIFTDFFFDPKKKRTFLASKFLYHKVLEKKFLMQKIEKK